jgi:hypothetical protein
VLALAKAKVRATEAAHAAHAAHDIPAAVAHDEPPVTTSHDAFTRGHGPVAWAARKLSPERLTHERVMTDAGSTVFGVSFGITFSQLEYLKSKKDGVEVVQVINADGSANLESVLWSHEWRNNSPFVTSLPASRR